MPQLILECRKITARKIAICGSQRTPDFLALGFNAGIVDSIGLIPVKRFADSVQFAVFSLYHFHPLIYRCVKVVGQTVFLAHCLDPVFIGKMGV